MLDGHDRRQIELEVEAMVCQECPEWVFQACGPDVIDTGRLAKRITRYIEKVVDKDLVEATSIAHEPLTNEELNLKEGSLGKAMNWAATEITALNL